MIAIIDYNAGNVYNVLKACQRIGVDAKLTADPAEIKTADAVLFPGVGAFKDAMDTLQDRGLVEVIKQTVNNGTPFLGICLGMQLLFDSSNEFGNANGLGLIPGEIIKIPDDDGKRIVPEAGWNQNEVAKLNSIFNGVNGQYTYFTHSYYAQCDPQYVVSSVDYGVSIPAIVQRDNIYGFQFHPEKSGPVGLKLLQTFFERAVRA
ncbi:imidazole glycerol phosphate synthase subunit HisH (plasmid) [Nicoliella spurrieriana]|uniref:Imidazole glycerol phosphate synthase subunit HisH n=1 Tax=Nicoliella spurrieriana TaxID=2925830 RepID=A0A976RQG9_9LACO|nr:imidazole glycerol phosphate synthase subunit HisH [Nicoliella spurrieriana]UQS85928.1 imidazole glycerol phosphate synthase subunit HisH [Nicoliella spurrieriana]